MKNIKVTRLNASHEDPENFLNNLVRITFSKKLTSKKTPIYIPEIISNT